MNQYPVVDEKLRPLKDVTLFDMLDEKLWLPRLALKANEISQFLFDSSCFDIVFKYDKEIAAGYSIEKATEVVKAEYNYPMFTAEISDSLKDKLIQLSLKESLQKTPAGLALKQAEGMYVKKDNDIYIRPLEPETGLVASLWKDRVSKMDKAYNLIMKKGLEQGLEL
jgi:hypothetical protein